MAPGETEKSGVVPDSPLSAVYVTRTFVAPLTFALNVALRTLYGLACALTSLTVGSLDPQLVRKKKSKGIVVPTIFNGLFMGWPGLGRQHVNAVAACCRLRAEVVTRRLTLLA